MPAVKPSTTNGHYKHACKCLFRRRDKVPAELQQALHASTCLQDLIALLFATSFTLSEAMIRAFDRRMDELEQGSATNVYSEFDHYLKTKNNGNRIV